MPLLLSGVRPEANGDADRKKAEHAEMELATTANPSETNDRDTLVDRVTAR
jgi:hypothetical protein